MWPWTSSFGTPENPGFRLIFSLRRNLGCFRRAFLQKFYWHRACSSKIAVCMDVGGGGCSPPRRAARFNSNAMKTITALAVRFLSVGTYCWLSVAFLGMVGGFVAAVALPVHVH